MRTASPERRGGRWWCLGPCACGGGVCGRTLWGEGGVDAPQRARRVVVREQVLERPQQAHREVDWLGAGLQQQWHHSVSRPSCMWLATAMGVHS